MPTDNDIESELSYSYLHAVCARVGCECRPTTRMGDNQKIDATVMGFDDYGEDALSPVTLLFQLKATCQPLQVRKGKIVYDLDADTYRFLRGGHSESAKFLLLLWLPEDRQKWLTIAPSMLAIRKCAYWLSLRGAPLKANTDEVRVFVPTANRFDVEALNMLLEKSSKREPLTYGNS